MTSACRRPVIAVLLLASVFVAAPAFAQQQPTPGVGTNYETRLDSIADQMRTLQGQIEQLGFNIKRLDQTVQRMQADTDARLARLEAAPPAPAVVSPPASTVVIPPTANLAVQAPVPPVAVSEPAPTAANGSLGAIKMQDGKVTGAINNPQAPPLPNAPPDYSLTPQEQYDRAFDLLRQANYEEAGAAFETFIAKNPQDKLIDNAKYWYGETLYVRGKFDGAAVAFADAYKQNPQGNKAPDSLLKMAMSLENIDKVSDACTTLESLKSKYPRAPLNIRQHADMERTKLKCSQTAAPPSAAH